MKKRNLLAAALLGLLALSAGAPRAQAGTLDNWTVSLGVTMDGAQTNDPYNGFGVRPWAQEGFGGQQEDPRDLGPGGPPPYVVLFFPHNKGTPEWKDAPGPDPYKACVDLRPPVLPSNPREEWFPVEVDWSGVDTSIPHSIVIQWDVSDVPPQISLVFQARESSTDWTVYDMRGTDRFEFPVLARDGVRTNLRIVATYAGSAAQPSVALVPSTATVQTGHSVDVQAVVTGADASALAWTLNGYAPGSVPPGLGSISVSGSTCRYTAPASPPPSQVTLKATLPGGVPPGQCTITVTAQPVLAPVITDFTPRHGPPGTAVLVTGSNFGGTPAANTVVFTGGAQGAVQQVTTSRDKLLVVVPVGARTGRFTLRTDAGEAVSPYEFTVDVPTVGAGVVVADPPYGAVGSHIGLSVLVDGEPTKLPAFNPQFYFNGVPAKPPLPGMPAATDSWMLRRVPEGAVTGPVTLSDMAGGYVATDVPFVVLQGPLIDRMLTPTDDPNKPGQPHLVSPDRPWVTIYGANFMPSSSQMPGYFDGCSTLIKFTGTDFIPVNDIGSATATELNVQVPPNAGTGPITVKTIFNNPETVGLIGPDVIGEATTLESIVVMGGLRISDFYAEKTGLKAGYVGDVIVIKGTNFDPSDSFANAVDIRPQPQGPGVPAPVLSVSPDGTVITAVVPRGALTGYIHVVNRSGEAVSKDQFTVRRRVVISPMERLLQLPDGTYVFHAGAGSQATIHFTATISGGEGLDPTMGWSLEPGAGGGVIDAASGVYAAPLSLQAEVKVTVRADALRVPDTDPGTFTFLLRPPLTLSLDPQTQQVAAGDPAFQITARYTTDNINPGVDWVLDRSDAGTLRAVTSTVPGTSVVEFVPPASLPTAQAVVHVLASHKEQPTLTAATTVTISDPLRFTSDPQASGQVTTGQISWGTNKNSSTEYRVWPIGGSQPSTFTVLPAPDSTKHQVMLTDLQPGTRYWYEVRSRATGHADLTKTGFFATRPQYTVKIEAAGKELVGPVNLSLGQSVTLTPHLIVTDSEGTREVTAGFTWIWTIDPSVGQLTQNPGGTATYQAPLTAPAASVLNAKVVARSSSGAGDLATGSAELRLSSISLKIYPNITEWFAVGASKQLGASVTGTTDTRVEWSLKALSPGLQDTGTVVHDASSADPNQIIYTAPTNVPRYDPSNPSDNRVTVLLTATSVADRTVSAQVIITVIRPPWVDVEPKEARVRLGGSAYFSATVKGAVNTGVSWQLDGPGSAKPTSVNCTYTAPTVVPDQTTARVRAVSLEPGKSSDEAVITIYGLSVRQSATVVRPGGHVDLHADVVNAQPSVTWSVDGVTNGSSDKGAITFPNGADTTAAVYTAPAGNAPAYVTIRAALTEDPDAYREVRVGVMPPLQVEVTPSGSTVQAGSSQGFTATIQGAAKPQVSWQVVEGDAAGTVTATGPTTAQYQAPTKTPDAPATLRVTVIDETDNETATVDVPIAITPRPVAFDLPGPIAPLAGSAPIKIKLVDAGTGQPVQPANVQLSATDGGTAELQADGTIKYTPPAKVPAGGDVTLTAVNANDPKATASLTIRVQEDIKVAVAPTGQKVYADPKKTIQFQATVTGTDVDKTVTWSLSPATGVGTIDPNTGLYTPPAGGISAPTGVMVIAKSNRNPSVTGFTTLTVYPAVRITVEPNGRSVWAGDGIDFTVREGLPVAWSVSDNGNSGTITPAGHYTAPSNVSDTLQVTITATYAGDAGVVTGSASLTVMPPIAVALSPQGQTVEAGSSLSLSAAVSQAGRPLTPDVVGLSWSVAGGDKDGTVKWDPLNPYSATYTAPATVAASRQVQVDAVTDVDPRFAGHLVITIVPKKAVVVTITSAPTSLIAGNTAQLTAQVLNATDTRVTWKATYGKVDSNGLYTAPDAPPPGGSDTVTATSVADTTKSDSAAILILPRLAITGGPNATPGKDGRSATITWTTNIDADGMVEFGTDTNYGAFVKQGDVNLVKSHLALITAGLTPGVTYHYRVKSGAPGQATVTSADATFTTPAPPISGTPPFATTTATTATITWSTDPQASGRVDYGLAQDKLDNAVPISGPDVSQHEVTLSGLTPNTTYYFRVTSSKQGYSSFTADGVFRTNALPSLVIVAGPNAKLVAPTTVLVTWSTNAPSNGIVGYGPNGQFTGQKGDYGTPPAVDHSVTLDGLDQNTLYQYQVTARAAGYNDAVSDVLTFKVPARYLPPKDLVASPEVTTATITWKTDAPATVKVEYGLDPGSLTKTVAGPSDPSTDHSVRLTDLTPSTLYYFRVTNQAKGYTDTTQDGSFYTFAPGQVVARNIAQMLNPPSASGGDWSAVITWETDVDSDGMVEYGTDETSLSSAVETAAPGKQHSVTITGLKPGTTYVYRVRSKAAGYTEGVSAFRTFTVTVERPAVHVVVAPRAENVHATDAEITWVTDVESDSTVEYGTGGAYNQKAQDSALTTSHRVKLAGLTSATQYSFRVTSSRDGYDPGTANDPSQKFTTKARVTIASQPDVPGWSVTVDSAVLPATSQRIQLEWAIGEPHKVAAPTPVDAGTGKRYVFTGWADGSPARERDVSVTGDTNLTAQYTAQFFLQVNTSPNIADASVTTGQDWYAQGSTATVTARDSISIGGVAYRLSKWRLDNVEAPAGPLNVKMDAPHNATAVYERSDTVGPAVAEVRAAPNPTAGAKAVTVRALISDLGLGDSQIAAAEYSVDTAAPAGSGVAMSAEDGAFNSAREYVVATVPADAWKAGTTHRIYVRGRDAQGNWGATGFVEVVVTAATGAPSAVTDLRASRQGTDRIGLAWTAPGGVAVAAAYDVRMSTSPISESSFSSATPVPGAPVPGSAGTPQAMLVTGLSPDTPYYFALKARDDAGNWSGMSNLASATTGGPPPTVTAVSPLDGATQVAVDVPISITFSKAMDATSVVLDANPPIGALSPSWSADRRTVTFTHAQLQGDSTIYQLRVTAAKDANGNDLAQPYAWSFTTIPPVNTGLAITPWPMFRRDSQHTGQSPYVGPSQPVQQWTASVRTAVSSPAMTNDRTLYVGSTGKALYALDGQTGQEKWSYGESSWVYSSPAIAVDGTVYIGLPSGGLHAVNPDGTRKWVFDEDQSPIRSSPAIGDDGTIFVGTDRGMYAVTPGGSKLWQFPTVAPVISSPALTSDGATVVFGCEDATLYALDAKTGVKKWTFKVQSVIRSSPVVGPDGTIYISSDDGYTYAIDPAKLSQPKWMAQTGTVGMSSPALADGRLYVGNSAGVLYAINLATGQTEWSYATNGAILGSPCVDHNGVIYVASSGDQQQRVYAFAGTGEVKWTWDVGSRISSSPVIGDDGTLYIGAQDKMIALRNLSNIMPGDLDGDGQVTVRDAQVALLIALDIKPATDVQRQAADLDKSGKVGVNDVSRILLRAIGLAPDPWP